MRTRARAPLLLPTPLSPFSIFPLPSSLFRFPSSRFPHAPLPELNFPPTPNPTHPHAHTGAPAPAPPPPTIVHLSVRATAPPADDASFKKKRRRSRGAAGLLGVGGGGGGGNTGTVNGGGGGGGRGGGGRRGSLAAGQHPASESRRTSEVWRRRIGPFGRSFHKSINHWRQFACGPQHWRCAGRLCLSHVRVLRCHYCS